MRKIIRHCKLCNAEYIGNKTKSYCSKECHDTAVKGRPSWNAGLTGIPSSRKRIERICKQCQRVFYGKGSGRGLYCTIECRKKAGRPDVTATRIGIEKICPHCNRAFYVPPSNTDQEYCSASCLWESTKQTRACTICGEKFEVKQSKKQLTCSEKCATEQQSLSHQAEKSHFWRGGKMAPYVGIWKTQRRAARERDGYKCVLCGSTDRIQVHHINPYRYSHSHDLENLVTLCRSCHSKEELKVNPAQVEALKQRWKKIREAAL